MNIAVVFAGGVGKRMHSKDRPKQFLLVHGKPIIIHTVEAFLNHEDIDGIIISCVEEWIPYMHELVYRYRIDKVRSIIPGGKTGQLSIYNGLLEVERLFGVENNIVLIHDGVRPLVDKETISENIKMVKDKGSAITCKPSQETLIIVNGENQVKLVPNRSESRLAVAPQSFWLADILEAERLAIADGIMDIIDCCTLMRKYGRELSVVMCSSDNIKITTPEDFYIFRALYEARENKQLE